MEAVELRDLDLARRFVLQGLRLQRVAAPGTASVRPALTWALVASAAGHPLPPLGFLADLGQLLIAPHAQIHPRRRASDAADLPIGLTRAYEDFVLGRFFVDASLARAADVIRRLPAADQPRGIAYVLGQMMERAPFRGAMLSPAVIKGLLELGPDEVMARAWDSHRLEGLLPLIPEMYTELIASVRRVGDVLAPEDVFELEHGTALAELSQRLALRQVLAVAAEWESTVRGRPRPRLAPREIPTRVHDADVYPVGGFASLTTRGAVESLLHSQLAYMDPDPQKRPDLFDVKFLRDELLYYSRDENQFWRRRQSFTFAFGADLVRARFKDPELPAQRLICALAWIVAAVRTLLNWLSTDALTIELLFPSAGGSMPLAQEQTLLEMIFREERILGVVKIEAADAASVADRAAQSDPDSGRYFLHVDAGERPAAAPPEQERLVVAGPIPRLTGIEPREPASGSAAGAWPDALAALLEQWLGSSDSS